MDDEVTDDLAARGAVVAKYVPFGSLAELTPYLWRRLLERLHWG